MDFDCKLLSSLVLAFPYPRFACILDKLRLPRAVVSVCTSLYVCTVLSLVCWWFGALVCSVFVYANIVILSWFGCKWTVGFMPVVSSV